VLARLQQFLRGLICAVLEAGRAWIGGRKYTKRLIAGCVIVAAVILDQDCH